MDLLSRIHNALDAVMDNAIALKTASQGDSPHLKDLQAEQKQLVAYLLEEENQLIKAYGKNWKEEAPFTSTRIEEKIQKIQWLHKQFIQNLIVRKKLIELEVNELNKARRSLAKMKNFYGPKREARTKLDTLS